MKKIAWHVGLWVMASSYVVVGVTHFTSPGFFLQIVPPYLPWPLLLVYLSGVAEVGLGVGALIPRTRRLAAWGIIALLVAVYPANLYMWTDDIVIDGNPTPAWFHPARLIWQIVLGVWAYVYTRPGPPGAADAAQADA